MGGGGFPAPGVPGGNPTSPAANTNTKGAGAGRSGGMFNMGQAAMQQLFSMMGAMGGAGGMGGGAQMQGVPPADARPLPA